MTIWIFGVRRVSRKRLRVCSHRSHWSNQLQIISAHVAFFYLSNVSEMTYISSGMSPKPVLWMLSNVYLSLIIRSIILFHWYQKWLDASLPLISYRNQCWFANTLAKTHRKVSMWYLPKHPLSAVSLRCDLIVMHYEGNMILASITMLKIMGKEWPILHDQYTIIRDSFPSIRYTGH